MHSILELELELMQSMKFDLLLSALLVICFTIVILLGALGDSIALPSVVPADVGSSQFSGERAKENLASIAQKPHPWYSQENKRVFE